MIRPTNHTSLVKIGPVIIYMYLSKSTCSKNLDFLQHLKLLAQIQHPSLFSPLVCPDAPSMQVGEDRTSNNLDMEPAPKTLISSDAYTTNDADA